MLLALLCSLAIDVQADLYHNCGKLSSPHNYMNQLSMIPMSQLNNVPLIKPSPVITKVINVVTKYVYKNPVCVKISGKKSPCKSLHPQANTLDHLVTKELFVKDRNSNQEPLKESENGLGMFLQGSEEPRPFSIQTKTPNLSSDQIKDMLIEDRLDQLETILPQYTRRRMYQTTTITVTKVRSNNRATATLLVKNCVPQGYDLCPPKIKRRRSSKIAKISNQTIDSNYFG